MKFTLICLALVLGSQLPAGETRFASFKVNLALTVADDSHKLSEDMVRICAQETDISMDELHKFRQNDFSNTSEATQCFAHCVYEQMGLIRDGVFVERDALRTLADVTDPNYYYLAKECHDIKGANKCETAFKIHQCRHQNRMNKLNTKAVTLDPAPMDNVGMNNNNNNNNMNNMNNNNNNNNGNMMQQQL